MIEELAAYILGVDADENCEDLDELLYDEFHTDLIVDKLMPTYDFGDGLCFYYDDDGRATHWMPLPDMPEVRE